MESVASIPAIEQSTLPQLRTAGAVQGCADAHQAVWMRSVRSGGDALPAPISLDFLQCRSGRGSAAPQPGVGARQTAGILSLPIPAQFSRDVWAPSSHPRSVCDESGALTRSISAPALTSPGTESVQKSGGSGASGAAAFWRETPFANEDPPTWGIALCQLPKAQASPITTPSASHQGSAEQALLHTNRSAHPQHCGSGLLPGISRRRLRNSRRTKPHHGGTTGRMGAFPAGKAAAQHHQQAKDGQKQHGDERSAAIAGSCPQEQHPYTTVFHAQSQYLFHFVHSFCFHDFSISLDLSNKTDRTVVQSTVFHGFSISEHLFDCKCFLFLICNFFEKSSEFCRTDCGNARGVIQ